MKTLFVLRHEQGPMAEYAALLSEQLVDEGIESRLLFAQDWIPAERGWLLDRKVGKRLRMEAEGFDLVHAFGYRCAWACSSAFYVRKTWTYSAFDMPRTTESVLIDRLSSARAGICSCLAVKNALEEANAIGLHLIAPGISLEGLAPYEPPERLTVAFYPEPTREHGKAVTNEYPSAQIDRFEPSMSPTLLVAIDGRAGFSPVVARAMARGVPVLVDGRGGLGEMVSAGHSGHVFKDPDRLGATICELLDNPLTLRSIGMAGRARSQERYDISRNTGLVASLMKATVR